MSYFLSDSSPEFIVPRLQLFFPTYFSNLGTLRLCTVGASQVVWARLKPVSLLRSVQKVPDVLSLAEGGMVWEVVLRHDYISAHRVFVS